MEFENFLKVFLGHLASSEFSESGSLTDYLDTPAENRSGDEADVVDRLITNRLIKALGYDDKEITYNRQNIHSRPDFVVKIADSMGRVCFIVEDKNTATKDIRADYPQLKTYMTQSAAPCGMLNNGRAILVYDHTDNDLRIPTIAVHLDDAVNAWQGRGPFTKGRKGLQGLQASGALPSLSALWMRFRRESFAELESLINDLTLQNDKGGNQRHTLDGKTWTSERSRLGITKITKDNTDLLTDAIKDLIVGFENDADAQLMAIEEEYRAYSEAAKGTPGYDLPPVEQEETLVRDALALMSKADPLTKKNDEYLLRWMVRLETPSKELNEIAERLCEQHGADTRNGKNGKSPVRRAMDGIKTYIGQRRRHLAKLREEHKDSIRVHDHFDTWKKKTAPLITKSRDAESLRGEFVAQAAYMVIIRILMIRILEDKGLMNRVFTNGGTALWFKEVEPHYMQFAVGHSADFLLDIAYSSAQHIYAHFFADRTVLDWYSPDRNAVVRVLHKLAPFDLSEINRDIIGTVYGQHVEAKHKHEMGMYFTPPDVVSFMLDRIGYRGPEIIGKKLLDLSCGSGGFLVEAASRLVDAYKEYWQQCEGRIPPDKVQAILDEVKDSLHGIDVNPFACSLAETNLLIQVMDLLKIARDKGHDRSANIGRFHIYNSDSLLFGEEVRDDQQEALVFEETRLSAEDQIKTAKGGWEGGFDYVVGNPPYVRADEGAETSEYRERIKSGHPSETVRATMVQKWDLFVPFMATSLELLKPGGRMAMITSNAIETTPYCGALRDLLVKEATVEEVHFFGGVKLFDDASVQNTITIATRRKPTEKSHTDRFWHVGKPKRGSRSQVEKQRLRQSEYKGDIFRQELPTLELRNDVVAIPLEDICYISKGMVVHADEKKNRGAFKMEDLMADSTDRLHPAPFVGGKDIDHFGAKNIRYIEYGDNTRVPSQVSRPTFPELYDRPKLMAARFGGFAYDDGEWADEGFLKCNHTVIILMPWRHLKGVDNKSIGIAPAQRKYQEEKSEEVDPWYALAFLDSEQMERLLGGAKRSSIKVELLPDDLRQVSVPIPNDRAIITNVSNLAKRAKDIQKKLLPLRMAGWALDDKDVTAPAVVPGDVKTLPLGRARVKWPIEVGDETCRTDNLERDGRVLRSGRREALRIPDSVPEQAAEWLRRQLLTLPTGTTLGTIEDKKFLIPETPELAAKSLAHLTKQEQQASAMLAEIHAIRKAISRLLEPLFKVIEQPAKKQDRI